MNLSYQQFPTKNKMFWMVALLPLQHKKPKIASLLGESMFHTNCIFVLPNVTSTANFWNVLCFNQNMYHENIHR